ncbi:MAG: hypothetical protein GY868_05750, partial [Deltaproteobacteria bacterium]|nr:hypothetical protein [Deltaproteobacteria bacterium]
GGGFPDVYCTLGEVCLALTRWDDTRQHAQSAIALNPAYGHAHVLMAQVYAERGAHCEAIEALEKGLSCQPPEIVARRARELLNALHGGKTDG